MGRVPGKEGVKQAPFKALLELGLTLWSRLEEKKREVR